MPRTPFGCSKPEKHLLLEKPGATTVERAVTDRHGRPEHPELVARVAYHRRHDARFRELADRVAAGEIGEPFAVHLTSREYFPPSDADAAAGGFIMDVGVHDFDTARWLLGRDPTAVFTQVHAPVYARHRRRQRLHHDRARRSGRDRPPLADVGLRHGHPLRGGRTGRVDPDRRADRRRRDGRADGRLVGRVRRLPRPLPRRLPGPDGRLRAGLPGRADRGRDPRRRPLGGANRRGRPASGARGERLEVGPSWDWNSPLRRSRDPRLQPSVGLGQVSPNDSTPSRECGRSSAPSASRATLAPRPACQHRRRDADPSDTEREYSEEELGRRIAAIATRPRPTPR